MRNYLGALLLIGVCGCAGSTPNPSADSNAESSEKKQDTDQLKLAVIPKSTGGEFWETVEMGANAAAADLDVKIYWDGAVSETEMAEQNRIIESFITQEVDGIALAPLNKKATKKQVQNAVDAGIPVVIFDSSVDGDAHTSFVATKNEQGGALGAEHLIKIIATEKESGGQVMLLRYIQGTASTEARSKGFIESVKTAGLELVADAYPDNGQIEGCKMAAANTMERYIKDGKLELDGVFTANLTATLGMLGALEDLRKGGIEADPFFVGFDTSPKLVEALIDGKIDALVAQNPKKMGYVAVETLVKHLKGETVDSFIDTGVEIVTAERLENEPAIRELVGLAEAK